MAVTDGGQLIRFPVDTVRIAARATKGVRLIRLAEGEKVVSVVRIAESDDDTGVDEGDEGEDGEPHLPQVEELRCERGVLASVSEREEPADDEIVIETANGGGWGRAQ